MAVCGECQGNGTVPNFIHVEPCKACKGTGKAGPDEYDLLFVPKLKVGGLTHTVQSAHDLAWEFNWLDLDLDDGIIEDDYRHNADLAPTTMYQLRFAQSLEDL